MRQLDRRVERGAATTRAPQPGSFGQGSVSEAAIRDCEACRSNALTDTTVEACSGRPSKGILSVTANTQFAGYTCFELDPSIDADTATVIASLNSHSVYGGGKINVLIGADAYANYSGCPLNSVLVNTARHTSDVSFLGLEAAILGVNIVVP